MTGPVERFHNSMDRWCAPLEALTKTPFLGAIPAVGLIVARSLEMVVALVDLLYSLITAAWECDLEPLEKSVEQAGDTSASFLYECLCVIPGYGGSFDTKSDTDTLVEDRLKKPDGFNPFWLLNAAGKVVWGVVTIATRIFLLIIDCGDNREKGLKRIERGASVMCAGVLDMIPYVYGEKYAGRIVIPVEDKA